MKKILLILLCVPLIGISQTAEYYYNKANDYYDDGSYQLAIDNYTKAIKIDPGDADLYYFRSFAYEELGQNEKALADLTNAININPNDDTYYFTRAVLYHDILDKCEYAILDYTKAIELGEEDVKLFVWRADCFMALKKYEDAINDCTRAIKIDPYYADAYSRRGIAKEYAGLPYCSDYKKGCELRVEDCCEWYNDQCK